MSYDPRIDEDVFGTRDGFEFRESGHVFRGPEFFGHIACIHRPDIRAAYRALMNAPSAEKETNSP